jgi:hypothetical protein
MVQSRARSAAAELSGCKLAFAMFVLFGIVFGQLERLLLMYIAA